MIIHMPYSFRCVAIPRGRSYEEFVGLNTPSCIEADNSTTRIRNNATFNQDECYVVRNYWAWSIFLMICTPYAFIFIRCFWRVLFKRKKNPEISTFLFALIIETLHTIGLCLLVFIVLPSLDNAVQMLMFLLGVALIPSWLKIFVRPDNEERLVLHIILDILALLVQLSVLIVWPLVISLSPDSEGKYSPLLSWSIPTSLFLISFRWWENFVDGDSRFPDRIREQLTILSGKLNRSRTKVQLVLSLWKIVLSLVMMILCFALQVDDMDPVEENRTKRNKFTSIFDFDMR